METLKNDLLKIVRGCLEVNGKVGPPLQAPSWRFPEKLASSVAVEECLKESRSASDSKVFILELLVDRLLYLVQSVTDILESSSSSHKGSAPALTLGSASKRLIKCSLKSATKIKTLKDELSEAQKSLRSVEVHLTDSVVTGKQATENEGPHVLSNHLSMTTRGSLGTPHLPGVALTTSFTQTVDTSFALCNQCFTTQKTLIDSVGTVAGECSKLKVRSELGSTNWGAIVELGDLDLTKWSNSLKVDVTALGRYVSRQQESIAALTDERDDLQFRLDLIDDENRSLKEMIETQKILLDDTKEKSANALALCLEDFNKKMATLTKHGASLESSNQELKSRFAASREEAGQLSSSLSILKAHCSKVEEELHQTKCHKEELERKRIIVEREISSLTLKADMLQDVLGHQQVELRKSQVYTESLENKHKTLQRKQSALLVQLDNLDQECAGLREEVAQVKLQRQKLEEELKDLRESQKHLQLLYEEKEKKLSESITEQKELTVQLASVRESLIEAEQELEFEKSNCRLMVGFPYICQTDGSYSDHIASLVCKRLSQKQIDANTVRIYLLEEQNNDLRYLNLKEAIKGKTENLSSRPKKAKKQICLWQKSVIDELERNWQDGSGNETPVNSKLQDSRSRQSNLSECSSYGIKSSANIVEPQTWAERRPSSSSSSVSLSRASTFKGNIGHLMKAIDLHRVKSPESGLKPPHSTPNVSASPSANPELAVAEEREQEEASVIQESMSRMAICAKCDKMCYEEPSGYCHNCGLQPGSAK